MIPADCEDINKEYAILLYELKMYNPELLDKPRMLAITKSDLIDDEIKVWIENDLNVGIPHIFISSLTQKGLVELKDSLWKLLHEE